MIPVQMSVDPNLYAGLSAIVFFIGALGVVLRRNPLIMLMSIELMWNAANLTFMAYARAWLNNSGHIFTFLVITVAAAEAAIGLAIVVILFRPRPVANVDDVALLKG